MKLLVVVLLAMCVACVACRHVPDEVEYDDDIQDVTILRPREISIAFRTKKHGHKKIKYSAPPDHTHYAEMARYIVHTAQWVSMGTISVIPEIQGFPFVNIISTADGPTNGKSTGIPYFYMTKLDFSARDLSRDNRLTVMISLDQYGYCRDNGMDPEQPTCARAMLSGKLVTLKNGTEEYNFANASLTDRHPIISSWPSDHNFFFAKLKIAQVAVLDWYGGPHYVPLNEYYNAQPEFSIRNSGAIATPVAHDDNNVDKIVIAIKV